MLHFGYNLKALAIHNGVMAFKMYDVPNVDVAVFMVPHAQYHRVFVVQQYIVRLRS